MGVKSGTIETPLGILIVTWDGPQLRGLELAPTGDQPPAQRLDLSLDSGTHPDPTAAAALGLASDSGLDSDSGSGSDLGPDLISGPGLEQGQVQNHGQGHGQMSSPEHSLMASTLTGQIVPAWVRQALADYFRDGTLGLDLPVAPLGTDFQRRVWAALRAIPPGTTRTYGDLARELDTSPRAIGGACRANPCLIAVPCHRVVARDGLGGFAGERGGERLAVKCWLLRHEGVVVVPDTGVDRYGETLTAPTRPLGPQV